MKESRKAGAIYIAHGFFILREVDHTVPEPSLIQCPPGGIPLDAGEFGLEGNQGNLIR